MATPLLRLVNSVSDNDVPISVNWTFFAGCYG